MVSATGYSAKTTRAFNLGMSVANRLLEDSAFLPVQDVNAKLLFECPTEEVLWTTTADAVCDLVDTTPDAAVVFSCLLKVNHDASRQDASSNGGDSEADDEGQAGDSTSDSDDDRGQHGTVSDGDSSSGESSPEGSTRHDGTTTHQAMGEDNVAVTKEKGRGRKRILCFTGLPRP
ncbi:unnamed protein product, partial [Laminaria digitata]